MKSIFDQVSAQCSKLTTNTYSTSFSLVILFLNKKLRGPINAVYGFVRFADEIVDSFEGYDRQYLLEKFILDTDDAISKRISLNPILNSFQKVVHDYHIEKEWIDTFLQSMQMDLHKVHYTQDKYEQYILGSAEVVGLMCLHVFTNGNKAMFEELKPYAMKLGSAFQKVNFLRDLKADYQVLGRTYFPGVDIQNLSAAEKSAIEADIESEFHEALKGIKKLPVAARKGVYLAYVYYYSLFRKIKNVPAQRVLTDRIRINNGQKFGLMINSILRYQMNLL